MVDSLKDFGMPNMQAPGTPVIKRVTTPLLGNAPQEAICYEDGGTLRIEGDIVVREAPQHGMWIRLFNAITFGHGVKNPDFLWPRGVIPYVVHPSVSDLVQSAIAHWHAHTPLRFNKLSGEFSYVSFEPGSMNESPVGCQKDKQIVRLVIGTTVGWAIHEIGHAVGLWHEHSRHDQNEHIVIHSENIKPDKEKHFRPQLQYSRPLGNYDCESAMHYPDDAFAIEGTKSISRRDGRPLGPRQGLSMGDIRACRLLYPLLDW